jgi:ABC-type branched-subunit amino acid transport system substrate-binding protein
MADHRAHIGFPDDDGADVFVREFPTSVAPADREYLLTKPPLFVIRVDDGGEQYDSWVRRVVEALRQPLDQNGKLVPYTVVEAEADGSLLTGRAADGLGFGIPRHMTPDRFPQFWLLHHIVQAILARAAGDGPEPGARALRDSAYEARAARGGLPAFLWAIRGGDPSSSGLYGWLLSLVWLPVTRTLPRWLWARRKTHQLIRPTRLASLRRSRWLGEREHVERGREDLFRVLEDLSQRQLPRLRQPAEDTTHGRALHELETLQLRALLEDLAVPPPGGLLPKRRRRTARPVLLVPIPRDVPEKQQELRRTERFLSAFHEAHKSAPLPGPLVIAVGQPSDQLLQSLDHPSESRLSLTGHLLHQRHENPVLVPLAPAPLERHGLPFREVRPRRFRTSWRTATSMVVGAVTLAVLAAGGAVWSLLPRQPGACVGGEASVAESARASGVRARPEQWFDAAIEAIDQENAQAITFAKQGRTVRTVVAFVSNRPTGPEDTIYDGVIPELRGIAMWQRKLNDLADSDDAQVPLIVRVQETGKNFAHAEAEAESLVNELGNSANIPEYQRVIGVLGFAQSRSQTKAALKVLDKARIITIGTTATADEMLGESNYWPLTPLNSREATIEARFAAQSNIVKRRDGSGCEPAKRAIVIESYGDLYSRSLAQRFLADFPGQQVVINYAQGDVAGTAVPPGMPSYRDATSLQNFVCKKLEADPDTVIYWSARARDFASFIDAFDTQATCTQHDITVLGGNELTNVSQTGEFSDKEWLRLYYSAHRLPEYDSRASKVTRKFVSDYKQFVKETTSGEDPWEQDGHAAVAYDAFHVLSRVANMTYSNNPGADPSQMQNTLNITGLSFNGATGDILYPPGSNQPPDDKTLVLLRQIGQRPTAVAACGAYDQNQSGVDQGEPCSGGAG